ncbi:MAG: ATP-binding protein [Chloroflexi bacterium]|nr:ATP-binding protein [Chloroflexota bacterium]
MKQLVVLSGKGGTGKTTVVAALAHQMARDNRLVLVDADVDAPNLGLILRPRILSRVPFYGSKQAVIDVARCTACGRCAEVCRYEAVARCDSVYRVEPLACEGCATCFYQCPIEAIQMKERLSGYWFRSETRFGPFMHAHLLPGEENSGKLVSLVRQQALLAAEQARADWILIDGSPGIGCPVIAAVVGVDLALMVAEPTLSGVHDLQRALQVVEHFGVRAAVCINKSDINPQLAAEIHRFCAWQGIPVLAEIPYDEIVLEAMRRELAVTELPHNPVSAPIQALWAALSALEGNAQKDNKLNDEHNL